MSQVDNRNSSAAKRARTDGARREDDWTCSNCGNVNFSFRTTCNMRNCTQPRPADHNVKSAAKPMEPLQGYSNVPYGGSAAPYVGLSPHYGSSLFTSIPPYDVPFPGGAAYHYNYGTRLSGGSHFRPLPLSGPPAPYSSGSMMGNGGIYGMPPPPMMERYGLSLQPMSPASMGPLGPVFFLDDKSLKKDVARNNDWACPKCGNVNFSFRTVCNMRKCNTPKPEPQGVKSDKNLMQKMPEGSWKCQKCGNINYPFRNKCNRQNCGVDKPSEQKKSPSPAPEDDEQVCGVMRILCHIVGWNSDIVHVTFQFTSIGWKKASCLFFISNASSCYGVFIDLQLSFVPVSTRTYLVVGKVRVIVQHSQYWCLKVGPCRLHLAAVILPFYYIVF